AVALQAPGQVIEGIPERAEGAAEARQVSGQAALKRLAARLFLGLAAGRRLFLLQRSQALAQFIPLGAQPGTLLGQPRGFPLPLEHASSTQRITVVHHPILSVDAAGALAKLEEYH